MSRCLPYTPSNYKREAVSLIGSIKKLQIQWRNTKKREKVSRKMNEKQNKKRSREDNEEPDSLHHKNKKRKADKNSKFNENSDHSDLSEEHDPPALVLSQCNSSKCTQNSNKKNPVQDSDSFKKKQGFVIRIKLPLKKHQDLGPESASTDPCRSSQVTQSVLTDTAPCFSSQVFKPSKPVLTESSLTIKEDPCFSGPIPNRSESRLNSRSGASCAERLERQLYRDLILNWKPPIIQWIKEDEDEDEDKLDWLFAVKTSKDAKPSSRICEADIYDPITCPSSASSLQPRATYLPEFAVYRLPYVLPF